MTLAFDSELWYLLLSISGLIAPPVGMNLFIVLASFPAITLWLVWFIDSFG